MLIVNVLVVVLGLLIGIVAFLGICALAVDTKREYDSDSKFYRGIANCAVAIILWAVRIRLHVSGTEKIPQDQPVLFVGNHRSNFDPIVTLRALKKWPIAYISKGENFKIPFFGRIVRKCCFMAIDRENPRKAIVTINRAAQLMGQGSLSVGVYPEGTRSKSGVLLPFHNGVFKIAQKANCPVVVVALRGTEQVHSRTPLRSTHVYLDVLDVLPAEMVKTSKTEVIGNHVRQLLEEHLST